VKGILISALAAGMLLANFGCATNVAPKMRVVTPIGEFGSGLIYVDANRDGERIQEALQAAGLSVVSAPADADLVLKAVLGKSRGSGECGSVRNAQYQLWQDTWLILKMVARGPIGDCPESMPNMVAYELNFFLDASRKGDDPTR